MNKDNLNKLIDLYEDNINILNNDKNCEYFKWISVKKFRDTWLSGIKQSVPFPELLKEALSESSVLIDNGTIHPANGIVKIAEELPEETERLFREILYSDDGGDIDLRQDNIDRFIKDANKLKEQVSPKSWKYTQDRHAASCYLTLLYPEDNYIYKYSSAEAFANAVEFGFDIGSGESFHLKYYYDMCDQVVEELKNRKSLLQKHTAVLNDTCYQDESLHLLAFDVIYCASAYHFVNQIKNHLTKKEAIAAFAEEQRRQEAEAQAEELRKEIQNEIIMLHDQMEPAEEINLIGIRVSHSKYGEGVVTEQDEKKRSIITVQFSEDEKKFRIDRAFPMRPTFEDDEEIVGIFTEYNRCIEKLEKLERKLKQ